MSKNDRVPDFREHVAYQVANHNNGGAEDIEPDVDDYAFADYLIRNAYRVHGFHTLLKRVLIVAAALVAAVALVLLTHWSAT